MTATAPCPTFDGIEGPLLLVGCRDGAHLRTAVHAGIEVVGVDPDAAVVDSHACAGLPVLQGTLAGPLPREDGWRSILLLDGAVRAGDDVEAVLARCFELLIPGGLVVVEAVADVRPEGVRAAVEGIPMLLRAADGFVLSRIREDHGRWFVGLRRPA